MKNEWDFESKIPESKYNPWMETITEIMERKNESN